MMDFFTKVELPQAPFQIEYNDGIVLLGSCFSDEIGLKLYDYCFDIERNTFGSLYNPMSIAVSCHRMINPTPFTEDEIFLHDGLYHSFAHQSSFSDSDSDKCLMRINSSLEDAVEQFKKINRLIITFGTAYVYRLINNGLTVANCHKLPSTLFQRDVLTVDNIVEEWTTVINKLILRNPKLKIIFTVSPIRHLRDGAHNNQLSKAILLLATEQLKTSFPEVISYFPAYELMIDELRDYRFYADDMLHPSSIAINYIWERFCKMFMDDATNIIIKEVEVLNKMLLHRPLNTDSQSYKHFLTEKMLKIKRFQEKYPYICIPEDAN